MPLALLALLASCAATPPPPPVPVSLPEPVTVSPEAEPVREPGPVAAPAAAPDPVSGQTGIAAEAKPPSLDFEVAAAPAVLLPPGIGAPVVSAASRLSVGSRDALAASFRDAYLEALFRGERLLGVYGGDKAHEWKVGAVASWVQNWRGAEARENSWGLKGLALAIKADGRERTVVLSGNLLDAFGRGAGRGGANGIAGYGPPLTDVYPSGDGIAVRFEFGLMEIEADGTRRFTMADPPSVFLDVPEAVGAGPEMSAARRAAFRAGWLAAVDSGFPAGTPDGDAVLVVSPEPAAAAEPPDPSAVLVQGVFVQTYSGGSWALALPVGTNVGGRARLLSGPFLRAFLADGSWLSGLARYGAPLTDPYRGGGGRIEQRFTGGIARADSRE